MNTNTKIATAALTITLALGGAGIASAAGTDGATGTGRHGRTVEQICAHKDTIVAKMTERQTGLQHLIDKLTAAQQTATDAGRTRLAARIGRKITHLQADLDRVTKRIAEAPAWIEANCA